MARINGLADSPTRSDNKLGTRSVGARAAPLSRFASAEESPARPPMASGNAGVQVEARVLIVATTIEALGADCREGIS